VGDEARSDIALAISALVLGPLLLGSLRGRPGAGGVLLDAAVVLALTLAVPLLLARSRRLGVEVFGLGHAPPSGAAGGRNNGPRSSAALPAGLALALPVALAGTVAMITAGAAPDAALLGRLSGSPLQLAPVLALTLGAGGFSAFLASRGREAFARSPLWTLTRLLRTVGMSAAAGALVVGLLRVPFGASPVRAVANATALALLVLLADRLVVRGPAVPRLAVLLPAGLALYLHITTFGLGQGLVAGALAAGTTAVITTTALGTQGLRALVPLLLAIHVWPTCLSPLALARGLC
jgi:hypothetical protein